MTIKVTMFFTCENYSWSEAHYYLGGTSFASTVIPASQLATLRSQLLGSFAVIEAVRFSAVPANRQVYELPSSNWPSGSLLVDPGLVGGTYSDQPYSALLINIQQAIANKNLYLAGIPDGVIEVDPNYPNGYVPSGNFAANLSNYMLFLTGLGSGGGSWGFRSRVKVPGTPVSAIGTQGGFGNNIGLVTAADPGVVAGEEAYLTGFRVLNPRVPGLAGAYETLAVIPPSSGVATWTTVIGETGNVDPNNFLTLGRVAPLTWQYLAYNNWRVVRATHRKRGGSFGLPRGRSRVRR